MHSKTWEKCHIFIHIGKTRVLWSLKILDLQLLRNFDKLFLISKLFKYALLERWVHAFCCVSYSRFSYSFRNINIQFSYTAMMTTYIGPQSWWSRRRVAVQSSPNYRFHIMTNALLRSRRGVIHVLLYWLGVKVPWWDFVLWKVVSWSLFCM